MSFSIYDLDEDIRKLLSLDNFLGGLSVNEFIEELSKDHFNKGAEVNKLEYLDPKPYIRTFESTVRELKRLHEDSERQMKSVDDEVEQYELKHSENVLALSLQVESITTNFSSLDEKISQVSNKIDPLGRSLNKITNSRDRSQETIFLIRAYHGFFTKETYEPLVKLKSSTKFEDKIQCAKAINNLLTLAKKIASPELTKANNCVVAIEKFSETFEKELLIKFDVYFEDDEYERMREIASILNEFNGGATVVQLFVNKHDFMLEDTPEDVPSLLDNETAWSKLNDPNFSDQVKDELTEYLLDNLRMTIKAEARIVQQVFEDPTPVLKIFIQRIYAQVIQNKTMSLLLHSLSVGVLAHVRVLHAMYVLLGDFTRDIKEFLTTNDLNRDEELGNVLDQCFYDLFIEYTTELTYFAREKKNLEDTVYEIAQKYNYFHEVDLNAKGLDAKIEILDNTEYNSDNSKNSNGNYNEKSKTSFGIGGGSSSSGSSGLSMFQDRFSFHFSEKKRLSQFKSFMKNKLLDSNKSSDVDNLHQDPEYDLYQLFNLTFVETVVKSSIESIARIIELAHNKTPEYSLEILEILLFDFGKLYLGACLQVAYEDAKREASFVRSTGVTSHNFRFNYLQTFGGASEGLTAMSQAIKSIFLPCAVNNPNIRSRMCNLTNNCLKRCEISINIILEETMELISNRISFLLTKQKKKDFVVENIDEEDTEACGEVTDFLNDMYVQVIRYLNGSNLKNFLVKVGMNLLDQLLEHYKRFPVNSTGGIILTRDVIQFQSTIDTWKIQDISDHFQILKEIANLFTVHPDLINSLVSEGQLANLKPYAIRQYVIKRTDFNPSYIERFFS